MLYISLRQYEYVVAVADAGSLTAAAGKLNVSQPSLSVAITAVEKALGQKIFVRQKGAAILITPFGHQFLAEARTLLRRARDIETQRYSSKPFIVGCFEDIAPLYLAHILNALKSNVPQKMFEGHEGRFADLTLALAEGRVDVALTYDIGFGHHFAHKKLFGISPVAFMSPNHPLAGEPSISLTALSEHPVILFNEELSESFIRSLFDKLLIRPKIAHKAASLEMMRSLAANGYGVGISYSRPPSNISYDGQPLVTVPVSTPEARTDIVLLWSSLREAATEFEQMVGVIERTMRRSISP